MRPRWALGLPCAYGSTPPPSLSGAHGLGVGGAPAHLGAGSLPHLAHAALRGLWPLPVGLRNPSGGPDTLPVVPETFLAFKPIHPIYLYLRTILELLMTSGISSGTTNNLR